MSDLRYKDKLVLEGLLGMSGGYVLNFSNRTFYEFIEGSIGRSIDGNDCSKANRLRQFWKEESNLTVAKLLGDIADTFFEKEDKNRIIEIAEYLKNIPSNITTHTSIDTFEHLTEFIKNAQEDLHNEKYWEVITKARTILEITFKEVCQKCRLTYIENDLTKAFDVIRKYFGMDAKNDYPNSIKGLISASVGIVNNIANARNDMSTSHAPKYKPKKHHAQFVLEQSISLMNFVISIAELKK